MSRTISIGAQDLIQYVLSDIPGPTGRRLRRAYYRSRFRACGANLVIDRGVVIQGVEWISLGDNVWIDNYCLLIAGPVIREDSNIIRKGNENYSGVEGELRIGNNVHVAPFCLLQAHGGLSIGNNLGLAAGTKVFTRSNLPSDPADPRRIVEFTPMTVAGVYLAGPVVLRDNVGVAIESTILPGVTIGQNSFVTPYSLVTRSFEENSYIGGQPARRLGNRFRQSQDMGHHGDR